MDDKMKRCGTCKQEKPFAEFSKRKTSKDGVQPKCKECGKKYYEDNLERINYFRKTHKEDIKAQIKKYRGKHKEALKAYSKEYRDSHKEEIKKHHNTLHGYLSYRWGTVQQRCANPNNVNYKRYGAKGILNCFTAEEFFDHVVFDLGYDSVQELKGLEIHRLNNHKSYKVGNITFITKQAHRLIHNEERFND